MIDRGTGDRWKDIGLLIIRLGFGLGYVYFHGWSKLTGGPERWKGVGSAVEHMGIGFGHTFFGFLAAVAESIGAIFVTVGFLFRPAALLLAAAMFVAWYRHAVTGQGTPAHAFKNMWVAAGLALTGPGRYSVDYWLAHRKDAPAIELGREE